MHLSDLVMEYAVFTQPEEGTERLHRMAVKQFSGTLIRQAELEDLTEENIAKHISRRMVAGRAAGTIAGEVAKLTALWRFACRQGYLKKWPTIRPVKVPLRVPRAWTKAELALVFKALEHARPVGSLDGYAWWHALFLVLWDTAERISAVLAVEWQHIDLPSQSIYIPAEQRKGKHGDRLYRIADDTAAALNALPRDRRPFYLPFSIETLYNRLKRMMILANLPADRQSKFHRMRRSTASHYEANGGNATELLGHTSRRITRLYLDPRIVKPESAIDRIFRPHG